jgi:hypothetical protein
MCGGDFGECADDDYDCDGADSDADLEDVVVPRRAEEGPHKDATPSESSSSDGENLTMSLVEPGSQHDNAK